MPNKVLLFLSSLLLAGQAATLGEEIKDSEPQEPPSQEKVYIRLSDGTGAWLAVYHSTTGKDCCLSLWGWPDTCPVLGNYGEHGTNGSISMFSLRTTTAPMDKSVHPLSLKSISPLKRTLAHCKNVVTSSFAFLGRMVVRICNI